jgi:hypothetical protein
MRTFTSPKQLPKIYFILLLLFSIPFVGYSQCTTTNATGCVCDDASNDCDLLPDITISWEGLQNYQGGPTEYSQSGNGANNGRLRVSGSTPNIGHGAFTARGVDDNGFRWFVCGTDTFSIYDPNATQQYYCPGGETARQIIFQRIYHKSGNSMSYYDIPMHDAMTYHPTHGHNHFDDWGTFTLRLQNVLESDPRNWDIVGFGAKLGFCLMDYGTCSYYNGHCRDDNTVWGQGNTLINGDFPNYGLGGGSYGCDMVEQGISSGYTDIYYEGLDGMWIDIPSGTCNGDYWIVYEVDPHDVVLEEDETNNYTAIPFTLTQQDSPGNPTAEIAANGSSIICTGDSVTLTATAGLSYTWSTGATTQSVNVPPGTYSVSVTSYCGTAASSNFTVTSVAKPNTPVTTGDTICSGATTILTATGTNVEWYDSQGQVIGTGNSFTTPALMSTTDYYAADVSILQGNIVYSGLVDNSAGGGNFTGDQYLEFDVMKPLILRSVKVYAQGDGNRTIEVYNAIGVVVASGVFYILDGEQRVDLDFEIPIGTGYQITVAGTPDLFRNNTGVSYPYEITDTISITTSSAGGAYYYFFYDWEIEVNAGICSSDQAMSTVTVEICNNLSEELDLTNNIHLYPNPTQGQFTVELLIPGTANVDMNIRDIMGRIIYRETYQNVFGEARKIVTLDDVPIGVYIVEFGIGRKQYCKRLVISH